MVMRLEFVDTNLFLRYLTNDAPDQADAVERRFESAAWLQGNGLEVVHTFDRRHFDRFGHLNVNVPARSSEE